MQWRMFSTNKIGTIRFPYAKIMIHDTYLPLHKNELKIDHRYKSKMENYKTYWKILEINYTWPWFYEDKLHTVKN